MDQTTRTYRLAEFAAVRQDADGAQADRTYKPTLQISSTAGRTKHISVSWDEFERIAELLTGQDATGAHSEPDVILQSLENLNNAAFQVIDCWDNGNLAEAVRNLTMAADSARIKITLAKISNSTNARLIAAAHRSS